MSLNTGYPVEPHRRYHSQAGFLRPHPASLFLSPDPRTRGRSLNTEIFQYNQYQYNQYKISSSYLKKVLRLFDWNTFLRWSRQSEETEAFSPQVRTWDLDPQPPYSDTRDPRHQRLSSVPGTRQICRHNQKPVMRIINPSRASYQDRHLLGL